MIKRGLSQNKHRPVFPLKVMDSIYQSKRGKCYKFQIDNLKNVITVAKNKHFNFKHPVCPKPSIFGTKLYYTKLLSFVMNVYGNSTNEDHV